MLKIPQQLSQIVRVICIHFTNLPYQLQSILPPETPKSNNRFLQGTGITLSCLFHPLGEHFSLSCRSLIKNGLIPVLISPCSERCSHKKSFALPRIIFRTSQCHDNDAFSFLFSFDLQSQLTVNFQQSSLTYFKGPITYLFSTVLG